MAFYLWDQNNSGGAFDVNDVLTHRLYIEADTYKEAELKAFDMGVYYEGVEKGQDCSCCGDRWYIGEELTFPLSYSSTVVFNTVEEHAQYMADNYGWEIPDARIFYKDGSVKEIYINKKQGK